MKLFKPPLLACGLYCALGATLCRADAPDSTPAAPPATAAPAIPAVSSAASAVPAAGSFPIQHVVDTGQTSGGPGEPPYSVSASWVITGYNDTEVIYSILITNRDTNVIRCTTLLNGSYLENGARHTVSDRQSVTLFPGRQSSAGTWAGLDQAAGATYKVTCRSVQPSQPPVSSH